MVFREASEGVASQAVESLPMEPPSLTSSLEEAPSSSAKELPPSVVDGDAVSMSDKALVEMLTKPPKLVSQLRTRDSFRRFFAGMGELRMRGLLLEAYSLDGSASTLDAEARERKVNKRMLLVQSVLK